MREILFRGKRIDNGEWIEGIPVKTHIGTFIVFEENPHYCNQYGYMEICELAMVDPASVGQYTGLIANGKKIFEGDILRFGYTGKNRGVDGVAAVIFEDGEFGVKWGWHSEFVALTGFANTSIEIIGNIHDNPELLKG